MSEKTIDQDAVRSEHLEEVQEWRQWLILGGVLIGSTVLMLALIAVLGASGG